MTPAAIALNRFGLGATPADAVSGDPRDWLLAQFELYESLPGWWAALERSPPLYARLRTEIAAGRGLGPAERMVRQALLGRQNAALYREAVAARTMTAVQSPAPFVERLVHFWANHFAVSVDKGGVLPLAGAFEADAIRPHVLGRFEDLLSAVLRHPAMQLYLDQPQSIGPRSASARAAMARNPNARRGLNENLAREILELHTLGVRGGYTQEDVTEFARALTGWSVPPVTDGGMPTFLFRPAAHEPGERRVLGRRYAEGGQEQAVAILRDLVREPATARHIATKLARHFIADQPPADAIDRLATAFMRTEGDLRSVYSELVALPQAWQPDATKFKTPSEWLLSALRATGGPSMPAVQLTNLYGQLGQPVWRPGSPAGYDDIAGAWAAPDALLRRVDAAQRLAGTLPAIDARALAPRVLPGSLASATAIAIERADTGATALALLLVAPEFMRR